VYLAFSVKAYADPAEEYSVPVKIINNTGQPITVNVEYMGPRRDGFKAIAKDIDLNPNDTYNTTAEGYGLNEWLIQYKPLGWKTYIFKSFKGASYKSCQIYPKEDKGGITIDLIDDKYQILMPSGDCGPDTFYRHMPSFS
jgi:hypothetical protein